MLNIPKKMNAPCRWTPEINNIMENQLQTLTNQIKALQRRVEVLEQRSSAPSTSSAPSSSNSFRSTSAVQGVASLILKAEADRVVVQGNTYNVRSLIKEQGGTWDKDGRQWVIPGTSRLSNLKSIFEEQGLTVVVEGASSSEKKKKKKKRATIPSGVANAVDDEEKEQETSVHTGQGCLLMDSDSD